jgi:hypothetical protein
MPPKPVLQRLVHVVVLLCVAVVAAEFTARLDDWWFHKIGFWSAPSYNDLFMTDASGQRRGKPEAHYQKWQMNSFGFRGPPIAEHPPKDVRRVMLLGASETFGLYESPQKEFAAQLAELTRSQNVEIVNAALPGITVGTLRQYWGQWAARFGADTVIIYPSVHLYVTCEDWPAEGAAPTTDAPEQHGFQIEDLRLFGRLKAVISQPDVVVAWRNGRKVEQATARHPASWVYTSPPTACIKRLHSDLLALIDDIRKSGANVIVCTQALRAARAPTPQDLRDLESFRVFSPRAPGPIIREFVSAADADILKLPAERNVRVVDVDAVLGGRRSSFEDLVHFNDRGSETVATLLRDSLVATTARAPAGTAVTQGSQP